MLFEHQEDALFRVRNFQNVAFYHDMGLGKTFTGAEQMARFGNRVNLVVCQKSKVRSGIGKLDIPNGGYALIRH